MDAFFDWPWRFYPAAALAASGVVLLFRGARHELAARRLSPRLSARPIAFLMMLRALLLGGSLIAVGAAWTWHQPWIFWLAVAIGLEETWETSMLVDALRQGEKARERTARG